jgi:hypothetical protein
MLPCISPSYRITLLFDAWGYENAEIRNKQDSFQEVGEDAMFPIVQWNS